MNGKEHFLSLVGNNIRKYRMAKSFSQQQLADELNIAKSTIQRIESGKMNPTIWAINNIAIVLEVSLEDLVRDTN